MTDRFPLKTAARSAARSWTAIGGIVTGLAGVGIVIAEQDTVVQGVLVGAAASAAAAFGVRRQAEPLAFPVADPRDDNGGTLRSIFGA
ncbi:hypothetical protein P3102_32610 [Amycolatopsis sp. QT-25]|uniref:hypothetical protein n=1 Tax=Amycolatopsis sp. QT-25 TaxID=3034022 RepID=UPI0023EBD61D|nr:hypothetical protein [Amycolatopsis sp. QT-25]WET78742.1 hypothetical protein P3102_32610 [Amycolatopsis sp. QT-25]